MIVLFLFADSAWACPACAGANAGAGAYVGATALLLAMPAVLAGALGLWLWKAGSLET